MKKVLTFTINLHIFLLNFHKPLIYDRNQINPDCTLLLNYVAFNLALEQRPACSASDQSRYGNGNWNFQWKKMEKYICKCYCLIVVNWVSWLYFKIRGVSLPSKIAHFPYAYVKLEDLWYGYLIILTWLPVIRFLRGFVTQLLFSFFFQWAKVYIFSLFYKFNLRWPVILGTGM